MVINTEAHPFPRFKMGPLFKTGWTRISRDPNRQNNPHVERKLLKMVPVETQAINTNIPTSVPENINP